ncbi:FBD-associated F-box protein At2g26860-like [Lactuca sativa]|uniref:F-box/LRR-repeat protein 15/At3g58940/PEG3-like LRR domain-containing protein n=1 Tax=Lactuca sativa TaxID=4236 RepID=A0A9R1VQL9_LACSA|nr:FBD-associated F-box protein At2g26860-like [Lactuca sativa]KAJ0209130.1 hypothetical protein LSAT_V11C400168470 [Lactuca sativa]
MVPKSSLSKWIDKAVKLNVCELDINVQLFDLPLSLFTCKTLTNLKVFARYRNFGVLNVPPLVILPCLKTLDISVHSKRLVKAFRLINGCPVLESLSLLILPQEVGDYNFNIPTLKRLELRTNDFISRHKVVLNLPNLEYLYVDGMLGSNFVMEDLSSTISD